MTLKTTTKPPTASQTHAVKSMLFVDLRDGKQGGVTRMRDFARLPGPMKQVNINDRWYNT